MLIEVYSPEESAKSSFFFKKKDRMYAASDFYYLRNQRLEKELKAEWNERKNSNR
jgi:hypothetical protein